MMDIFDGTIEGHIANAIERWVTKNDYPLPLNDKGGFDWTDNIVVDHLYNEMDAQAWIESTNTEDTTFAYICSHDPRQMFDFGWQIAILRRNMDTSIITEFEYHTPNF